MSDLYRIAIVLALGATLVCVLYLWGSFDYRVENADLVLRWRILGSVPFRTKRIALQDIPDVHRLQRSDYFRGGELFGSLAVRSRGVVAVRRDALRLANRVIVTPSDRESFIAEVTGHVNNRR